ncbi:MAG: hypothetical protein ABR498_03770 [Candidatus Dormibacteria bacterium]
MKKVGIQGMIAAVTTAHGGNNITHAPATMPRAMSAVSAMIVTGTTSTRKTANGENQRDGEAAAVPADDADVYASRAARRVRSRCTATRYALTTVTTIHAAAMPRSM